MYHRTFLAIAAFLFFAVTALSASSPFSSDAEAASSQNPAIRGGQPGTGSFLSEVGGVWQRLEKLLASGKKELFEDTGLGKWFDEHIQLVRFNVDGVFARSRLQGEGSKPLEGGRFSGTFAPALRFTEDTSLVLIYTGNYNRELQIFTEDEGPRQRSEEQRHDIVVLLSRDFLNPLGNKFIDRLTISPSFIQTYVFTRQTADEDWKNGIPLGGIQKFKGLYDYWDRGTGVEFKLQHKRDSRRDDNLSITFQAFRRHYRNFISLARTLDRTSLEPKFEKDFWGTLVRSTYNFQNPGGLSLRAGYTLLRKSFTEDRADKDPLESSGVPGERRRDVTQTFEWGIQHPYPWISGLEVGLGGNLVLNTSTSGFNDTLAPLSSVGVFTKKYYDYRSVRLSPEINYFRKINKTFFGYLPKGDLSLSGAYSWDRRAYMERGAKDKLGNLKRANEVDTTQVISLNGIFQFHKNWALLFGATRTISRSNSEDERTFRFSYDINSFSVGFRYRF